MIVVDCSIFYPGCQASALPWPSICLCMLFIWEQAWVTWFIIIYKYYHLFIPFNLRFTVVFIILWWLSYLYDLVTLLNVRECYQCREFFQTKVPKVIKKIHEVKHKYISTVLCLYFECRTLYFCSLHKTFVSSFVINYVDIYK